MTISDVLKPGLCLLCMALNLQGTKGNKDFCNETPDVLHIFMVF
jgi:hypothetical protein